MRIGLIIYGRLDQRSGGYLYDRKLVEFLQTAGHEVEVFSLPWRSYLAHLGDNFSRSLLNRLCTSQLDLLLQDELNHASLFLLNTRLKKLVSFPIMSIVHHLRSSERQHGIVNMLYRIMERLYLRSVDAFIFNSQTTKKTVLALVSLDKKSVVAPPGKDRLRPEIGVEEIRARASTSGPLRVVFLGSLIHRKAPHLLIEAAAKMDAQSVKITFVGDHHVEPAYVHRLRKLVQRLALEDSIEFHGYLEPSKLVPILRTNHILALPSSYEGYGIAYVEGMGFGMPAIGTRSGAAAELVTHGKNGCLINVGNANDLTRVLQHIHKNRESLVAMSLAAKQTYETSPTWQTSLASIEGFLSAYNKESSQGSSSRRS